MGNAKRKKVLAVAPTAWSVWASGLLKSWTVWFGALLLALPDLLPALSPHLADMLSENIFKRTMNVAGIIVILLRMKTTQSLTDKGTPPGKETSP